MYAGRPLLFRSKCIVFRFDSMVSCGIAAPLCRWLSTAGREVKLMPPEISGSASEKVYPLHIDKLVDDISRLTLLEVSELTECLQKRLNIKSPMFTLPSTGSTPQTSTEPETTEDELPTVKTSFTVKLAKFDATKKVQLIKEIKSLLPEMNLAQAKKFVESAPGDLKTDVSKDEAEEIKKTLESAGATIVIE
ncbi:unnamed protein product [Dicrocoelium dendriticum]|nr:unnamed protein product [Dicrocoelium dendriticum]